MTLSLEVEINYCTYQHAHKYAHNPGGAGYVHLTQTLCLQNFRPPAAGQALCAARGVVPTRRAESALANFPSP